MLQDVTCVGYLPLLVEIPSGKNNNQKVLKPLVLVKAVGKSRTNTRRLDVFNPLISLVDLPEVLLVVRVMGMVTPHLGRKESCLLMSKRKKILGSKLNRNCLRQNFSKELRPARALIVVSKVISLRLLLSQSLLDY
jgi:hypothetical protein